jgi:hypothetical protein
MAPRKETLKGTCLSCGVETTKNIMPSHISNCTARDEAIAAANANATTPAAERLFHLRVQALYEPEMWLDIEMRGEAKLSDLDLYLLAIWLDCGCYHRSYFSQSEECFGPGMSLTDTIASVFQNHRVKLFHSYDNQSSQCMVTCKCVREGKPLTGNPIVLLARNTPILVPCKLCAAPATQICTMCFDDPEEGVFCENHIRSSEHPCITKWDDLLILPVMNSPRSGICAYCGPAEPPY